MKQGLKKTAGLFWYLNAPSSVVDLNFTVELSVKEALSVRFVNRHIIDNFKYIPVICLL